MSRKTTQDDGRSLFDELEGLPASGSATCEPRAASTVLDASYRALLVEQVRRDTLVLSEDPIYHVPSREFYEARITMFKELL